MKKFKYIEEYEKQINEIAEQLQPHFKEHGTIKIENNKIILERHNGMGAILCHFGVVSFDNSWERVKKIEVDLSTVWSEIGENLQYVEVLPFVEFNLEEWKRKFAERHGLIIENNNVIKKNGNLIIRDNGNVNYRIWNKHLFENKHQKFKFDGTRHVIIDSQELAEEFERVYVIMRDYLDKIEEFPSLEKNDNENNK